MDWFTHNFIADMYGPQFLVFYGIVIIVTLAACWWATRNYDPTSSLPPPQIPAEPDPYEMACLRGGENEVARLVIFSLIQRGYLQIGAQHVRDETRGGQAGKLVQPIERAQNHPDPRHLSPIERMVFDWLATPRAAGEIFQSELPSRIKVHCASLEQRLITQKLLMPPEWKQTAQLIVIAGALVIIGLGGYKLFIALGKGRHNVGFLIIMGLIASFILFKTCRPSHLSRRGQLYLERLQQAFEKLKSQVAKAADPTADPMLLMLVSLFGVSVLAGTAYSSYQQTFQRATAASGAWGSGSSCGSGCGSSSSCGSSCGSCGGGGCGGGCGGCGGA